MQSHYNKEKIIIVDFGSQFTKLIARRVREFGVYSEIITPQNLKKFINYGNVKGLIFSGGPSTVTRKKFQSIPKEILKKKIPILGICYGLQLIAKLYGGKIKPSKKRREFGRAFLLNIFDKYKYDNSLFGFNTISCSNLNFASSNLFLLNKSIPF